MRPRAWIAGLALCVGLAAAPRAGAEGERPLRAAYNDRFLVVYRAADEAAGKVTQAEAAEVAQWAKEALAGYEALGLRAPCLRSWRGRYVIGIVDFAASGDPARASGRYFPRPRKIRLNLAMLRATGRYPWDAGHRPMRGTVAHEIFHAIQYAYGAPADAAGGCTDRGPGEPSWFKEATANWAADAVVPGAGYCVRAEARNLLVPGPYHWFEGEDIFVNAARGRAYGASAFFRFWAAHEGAEVLRRVFEACEGPEPNALEAIGRVMGDDGPLGPRFRAWFDRFRVGCLLRPDLPEGTELRDAEHLRRGTPRRRGPLRPALTSLTAAVAAHFGAGREPAEPLRHEVRLAPLETRYLAFLPPAGLAPEAALEVRVEPADPALGVQVLVPGPGRYGVQRVAPGAGVSFAPARLPAGRGVGVILTRYEAGPGPPASFEVLLRAAPRSAFTLLGVRTKDLKTREGQALRVLVGEVRNDGSVAVTNPLLRARGTAPGVRPLSTHLPVRELAPGETTSFTMAGPAGEIPGPDLEVYNVHEAAFEPVGDSLAFEEVFLKRTFDPRFVPPHPRVEVQARLRNVSDQPLSAGSSESQRIVVTLYDAAGGVIGVGSEFVHGTPLAPGASSRPIRVPVLLLEDTLAALRLTARVEERHRRHQRVELGRVAARHVRTVQDGALTGDEVATDCDLPAWPFPVRLLDDGGLFDLDLFAARAPGPALARGGSRTFANAFHKRTVGVLAGVWIEVPTPR